MTVRYVDDRGVQKKNAATYVVTFFARKYEFGGR